MKNVKKIFLLALIWSLGVAGALHTQAQESTAKTGQQPASPAGVPVKEDFSDASLKRFIEINRKLQPQQKNAETQMVRAITQEGLTPDRFTQILSARQRSDSTAAGASAAEMTKFNNAAKKIMDIQNQVIPAMEKVIAQEGMSPAEFQQIALAYNQSQKVQQRINEMLKQGNPAENK